MTVNSRAVASALCLVLACSCGVPGSGGNVEVDVALDPGLAGQLEVVSIRGDRPGTTNPIDVEVVLRNPGTTARRVALEGRWQDSRGGFQGGANAVRIVQPGAQETFTTGTRSSRATTFHLAVSETTTTEDEMLTATLADSTRKAPGQGITYTETPSIETIPSWTPRGVANGQPFTAQTLLFRPNGDGWRLEISDRAFDPLGGTARPRSEHPDLQTVYLDLPAEPVRGQISEREMNDGGGFFQIKQSPASSTTTSWNTALGWAIEIEAWNRSAWDERGATFQHGGTASGKLYVAFRGTAGGIGDSWLSGSFRDVPIVYYGRPPAD